MIHITITGPHAGQILCGKSRCEVEDGDRTAHWPYSMTKEQEAAFRSQVCPDCLKEWDYYCDSDESPESLPGPDSTTRYGSPEHQAFGDAYLFGDES